jgi:sodium-dependent dicarboxylate transporter 2/3/5
MSHEERLALLAFLGAAWLWVFRNDIDLGTLIVPGWSRLIPSGLGEWIVQWGAGLSDPLARLLRRDLGDAAVAMGVGLALLCIPISLRPPRFALPIGCLRGLPWRLLVLLGGGIAMAHGIQESGLSGWIAELLQGMKPVEPFSALLAVTLITVLLTEVASNLATASMLLPIIATSAESFGLHPVPLMLAATIAASFGFMLPAGTPPNAIVYSSGYISVPQMARSGILVDLFGAFLVALICHLLAPWVLGVGPLA